MPFNLIKKYPELLDLAGSETENKISLRRIFDRDIANVPHLCFRGDKIYPTKHDGEDTMGTLFTHLICKAEDIQTDTNKKYKQRVFDRLRAERLHWIAHHLGELQPQKITVFTLTERDQRKRRDVTKTYIYDQDESYVIVLEHQRSNSYYLLTAYYITEDYTKKSLAKKMVKSRKQ